MIKRKGFIKKFSQKDVPRLKRKLWPILSRRVKERDGNKCFTCGKPGLSGSSWHAGHMFPAGSHGSTRFLPANIFSQCYNCNINLGGNGAVFASKFIARYGLEIFERIRRKAAEYKKWTAAELVVLIEKANISMSAYATFYEQEYGPETGIY